jgi:RNA polymerase-binding protein DksA
MSLTSEQLRELKQTLTQRRESLESEAHADASKARGDVYSETAGPVADAGDEATADVISDVENAELSRDLNELREIDSALGRIAAGSYGTCIECRRGIDLERLRRQPTALRCFDCQSVFEKTFLQPNKPTL